MQGTIEKTLDLSYIVTGLRNIAGSDMVIVASWEQFYILNFASDTPANWNDNAYYYLMSKSISRLTFSSKDANIMLAGLAHVTLIKDTVTTYCHPYCNGCTQMLSEYKCSACIPSITQKDGACLPDPANIVAPPGGAVDLTKVSFSADNVKPEPPKGFNIKDYYMYIIIGAGGILGLLCLCCICKICCGNSDDEEAQRRNQVRQRKEED